MYTKHSDSKGKSSGCSKIRANSKAKLNKGVRNPEQKVQYTSHCINKISLIGKALLVYLTRSIQVNTFRLKRIGPALPGLTKEDSPQYLTVSLTPKDLSNPRVRKLIDRVEYAIDRVTKLAGKDRADSLVGKGRVFHTSSTKSSTLSNPPSLYDILLSMFPIRYRRLFIPSRISLSVPNAVIYFKESILPCFRRYYYRVDRKLDIELSMSLMDRVQFVMLYCLGGVVVSYLKTKVGITLISRAICAKMDSFCALFILSLIMLTLIILGSYIGVMSLTLIYVLFTLYLIYIFFTMYIFFK